MLTTVLLIAAVIADLCIYMNGSRIHFGSEEDAAVVQGDGYSIKATIDGKYISKEVLDRFVIKRIRKAEKKLDLAPMKVSDADTMLAALTDEKMKMGPDAIARKLDKQIRFCDKVTVAIIRLSGGKTKFCITEVEVNGVALDRFLPEFDRLQAENSLANLRTNLGVEPDHYYLAATDDGQLEVIEACGSSPVPTKMFIRYGDETGLGSKWESDTFEAQRPGAARLQTGAVQGGVRHQFKKTEDGFKAKLLVEFPTATPGRIIKNHQMHLAIEFSNWVKSSAAKSE
jgi:hypothetical protein